MFENLTAFTDSFLQMGTPGSDLMIWQDGQCILRHLAGVSDWERQISMTGTERYNIYSCSKAITVTAALQLWEKGLYSLEDRLCDYLPEFAEMQVRTPEGLKRAEQPILIGQLFDMTAGFSYDVDSPQLVLARQETGGACPTRETMRYLAKEPLLFEPGTRWYYSLCHDVLAALVEVWSGERFSDYVQAHIFRPLAMDRTTFHLPEDQVETLAAQYLFDDDGKRVNCGKEIYRYKLGWDYESGGAGCVSCADDYIKFLEALRVGDVVLGKDTVAWMSTDRVMCRIGDSPELRGQGYGLGFRCRHAGSPAWNTEFGWGGAAGAYYAVDIPRNMTIFYVQQVLNSPMHDLRNQIYRYAVEDLARG